MVFPAQVIARPKLATPTIYQHSRSATNDHSSLGLGATTPPSTTRDVGKFRGKSSNYGTFARAGGDNEAWDQHDAAGRNGYTGNIHAWDGEEETHHDEQVRECCRAMRIPQASPSSQKVARPVRDCCSTSHTLHCLTMYLPQSAYVLWWCWVRTYIDWWELTFQERHLKHRFDFSTIPASKCPVGNEALHPCANLFKTSKYRIYVAVELSSLLHLSNNTARPVFERGP